MKSVLKVEQRGGSNRRFAETRRIPPVCISGFGQWQDAPKKLVCTVTWEKFEEWGNIIYDWVLFQCSKLDGMRLPPHIAFSVA